MMWLSSLGSMQTLIGEKGVLDGVGTVLVVVALPAEESRLVGDDFPLAEDDKDTPIGGGHGDNVAHVISKALPEWS